VIQGKYMDELKKCLTYEDALRIVSEAKTIAKKAAISLYGKSQQCSIELMIGLLLNKFLEKIGLELRRSIRSRCQVSEDEKAWAIDFLEYLMSARPKLCLDIFEEQDEKEVLKFIKNKIYCALFSDLDIKILFDNKDLKLQKRYRILRNQIKRKKRYYVLEAYGREYRLPVYHFEMPVFYHKYGIPELPREVIKRLEGRDFIDGGAFIGDSTLVLSEFKPRRIYAFEPLTENYALLLKTIKLNNLSSLVISVKKALGSSRKVLRIAPFGSASFISDVFGLSGSEEIEVVTLDEFVKENNLDVGLIKLDVEGYELDVLNGAKETITRFKPVMSIAVYHRGEDFFEIPRLVKNLVPEYKLRFLNLNAESPTFERILLAYTKYVY
jgi:FkbM family methyltransferase